MKYNPRITVVEIDYCECEHATFEHQIPFHVMFSSLIGSDKQHGKCMNCICNGYKYHHTRVTLRLGGRYGDSIKDTIVDKHDKQKYNDAKESSE